MTRGARIVFYLLLALIALIAVSPDFSPGILCGAVLRGIRDVLNVSSAT